MVHERFQRALAERYVAVKLQFPGEGRRRWRLRVLYDAWPTITSDRQEIESTHDVQSLLDSDPTDQMLEDDELGLILRTDFTNDTAWNSFCQNFKDSQKEFISELIGKGEAEDFPSVQPGDATTQARLPTAIADHDEGDSESSTEIQDIIKVLDPPEPIDRAILTNISNIAALRMFNDVDIHRAPLPPSGTKRISPQNPLIDQGGWQEIYCGKNLWIYDSRSNVDGCVRVVNQTGEFYGTASGDSWRGRASHICELQFNMSHQGMKIDFGGLDRWDWEERARNLKEAISI